MKTRVGIYFFPNVDALDFAGPYEVFTTANRCGRPWAEALFVYEANKLDAAACHTLSVAKVNQPVQSAH